MKLIVPIPGTAGNGEASTESDGADYILTRAAMGDDIFCTAPCSRNLIATALHCVTHSAPGLFSCEPDGALTASDRSGVTSGLAALDIALAFRRRGG